jgi:plasmid stabilization system protein ParE
LNDVLTFIDRQSPQGAQRVKTRILATIELVLQYPDCGRLTNKSGLRRVSAYPYPYVIFYRASSTDIVIHAIRHAARDPRSMPG